MIDVKAITRSALVGFEKNAPTILTVAAGIGVVSTAALAIQATAESYFQFIVVDPERPQPEASVKNVVVACWKNYIPTLTAAALTIGCVVAANSIHLRREAALLAAYALADGNLKDYKSKIEALLGKKKSDDVRDKIAEDKISDNPPTNVMLNSKTGVLCLDVLSGRYFRSSVEKINAAVNELNYELVNGAWVDLNAFYGHLGLDGIALGGDIGWNSDNLLEVYFTSALYDGEPILVLNYHTIPKADYYGR